MGLVGRLVGLCFGVGLGWVGGKVGWVGQSVRRLHWGWVVFWIGMGTVGLGRSVGRWSVNRAALGHVLRRRWDY